MNYVLKKIFDLANKYKDKRDFKGTFFGDKINLLDKKRLVIYGAGSFAKELYLTLKFHNIDIDCFCDKDTNKVGTKLLDKNIISVDELVDKYKDELIIIGINNDQKQIVEELVKLGFDKNNLVGCKTEENYFLSMYGMIGTQAVLNEIKAHDIEKFFYKEEDEILQAYEIFKDNMSKELFLMKMALFVSGGDYFLFKDFIKSFSLPYKKFRHLGISKVTEDFYYFNNDVLSIKNNEVYVDVGAFDGDTILEFVKYCQQNKLNYKKIYGFEPDEKCLQLLKNNTKGIDSLEIIDKGLWEHTTTLSFTISEDAIHEQAASIDKRNLADKKIKVVSLDDFFQNKKITFLKMDPGGNVIPNIIKGGKNILKRDKPKMAVGAYHSVKSLYEIPLMVKEIVPEYEIYLRHGTYHLSDTDMFAYV